jgi:regulator of RNase E activity RraB
MQKNAWFRSILILVATVATLSLVGCSLSLDEDDDDGSSSSKRGSSKKSSSVIFNDDNKKRDAYESLVINDFDPKAEDYIIETHNGSAYIFLSSEIITYPFKLPYSTDEYPELSTDNGQISMTWMNNNEVILKIDMVEGSKEAYINDSYDPIDIGAAPKIVDDKLFIPINLFVQVLKMKETYDPSLKETYLHYEEDFPKDYIVGNWSDNDTDLFTSFKDISTGYESLSSFANAYQFNADGTYRMVIVAVGGFEDALVQCTGKYKILGNTIIYYNTRETLYEGTPFKLTHKNKKLDKPSYEFITDYDPDEGRIKIGAFWLHKVD